MSRWEKSNLEAEHYGQEIAKQIEEQVQQELDELCEPMDEINLRRFWVHFASYFESKYFT